MPDFPINFGKYQLLRLLGKGGFGEVFYAKDLQTNTFLAVKVLHQGLAVDAQFIKNVRREAELVRKIQHPNVVKVLDVGEAEGRVYIAMEYIEGYSLGAYLASGTKYTLSQALNIIDQTADALEATHAQKIVHRDVKPENILLGVDGNVHLADFGLAYAAKSTTGTASAMAGVGTAKYMAPEQARNPGTVRSDVYSLAVVAYELIVGNAPFNEPTRDALVRAHQETPPPPPTKKDRKFSKAVEQVLLKGLAKDPNKRYASARQFADALRRAAEWEVRPAPRLSPWLVLALLLLVLAAAAITGMILKVIPLPGSLAQAVGLVSATPGKPMDGATPTRLPVSSSPTLARPTLTAAPATALPAIASISPLPSLTASLPATLTPYPSLTPSPTPRVVLDNLTSAGVQVSITGSASTQSGFGRLFVQFSDGAGQPIKNVYVTVYTEKQDLAGKFVHDENTAHDSTDSSGGVQFDLNAGSYIVSADMAGYQWGTAADVDGQANVEVKSGQVTKLSVKRSQLKVGFMRADRTVIQNQYVQVYKQKQDIAKNWVSDGYDCGHNSTDNTGSVVFDFTPGYYIVSSEFAGYNWGDATDMMGRQSVPLVAGQPYEIIYTLGRIRVELVDGAGKPIGQQFIQVFKQKKDANGNTIADTGNYGEAAHGSTDLAGLYVADLTPGLYAVKIKDVTILDVPVQSAKITVTNGLTVEIQ